MPHKLPESAHVKTWLGDLARGAGVDEDTAGFADDSLDYVLSLYAFDHFPDPFRVLWGWHRVLVDGGLIYMTVLRPPDPEGDGGRDLVAFEHLWEDYLLGSTDDHMHSFSTESVADIVWRFSNRMYVQGAHHVLPFSVLDRLDPDDVSGDGHAVVIKVHK
jgi:SAM-dependent methyltransferase